MREYIPYLSLYILLDVIPDDMLLIYWYIPVYLLSSEIRSFSRIPQKTAEAETILWRFFFDLKIEWPIPADSTRTMQKEWMCTSQIQTLEMPGNMLGDMLHRGISDYVDAHSSNILGISIE
jgi:hypothetical protein